MDTCSKCQHCGEMKQSSKVVCEHCGAEIISQQDFTKDMDEMMANKKYQYRVCLYDQGRLTKEVVFKDKTEAQGYGTYFKFRFGMTFTVTKEPVEEL